MDRYIPVVYNLYPESCLTQTSVKAKNYFYFNYSDNFFTDFPLQGFECNKFMIDQV